MEWLFPLADLNDSSYPDFIAEVGALAMGPATYEWIVRNAAKVAAETGFPRQCRGNGWWTSSLNQFLLMEADTGAEHFPRRP